MGKLENNIQTIFNFPDRKTSLKILDHILNARVEEAYNILSGFYKVPKIKVICDEKGG